MGEKTASKGGFPIGFMDFTSGVFITFEVILTLTVWAFFIFFILDLIFDFIITRRDLRELRAKENVILSGKIQKSSLRVLVVTTTKERLKNLMRITQSVDSANFFWFTTFKEAGPDSILTEPIWTVINIEDNRVEKLL
jgi:hypothetical protein